MKGGVPKLKDALKRAKLAGLRVELVNSTGEVRVGGLPGDFITLNARKKDAPYVLITMIKRYEK